VLVAFLLVDVLCLPSVSHGNIEPYAIDGGIVGLCDVCSQSKICRLGVSMELTRRYDVPAPTARTVPAVMAMILVVDIVNNDVKGRFACLGKI